VTVTTIGRAPAGIRAGGTVQRCGVARGLAALVALVSACAPSEYIADYGLLPAGSALLNGDPAPGAMRAFVFHGVAGVRSVRYQDERVAVDWTLYSRTARLVVENRTAAPLRVFWSEARIEGDFEAPLVLSTPGTADARDLPQEPTIVAPADRASYSVIPGPPGRWQHFTNDPDRGFWQMARSMFDLDVAGTGDRRARDALAERAVGSELRLVLSLEIEGARHEFRLPARVVEASVRASYY
jgi:hypothetical protein